MTSYNAPLQLHAHFLSPLSRLSRSMPASSSMSRPGARPSLPVLLGLVDPRGVYTRWASRTSRSPMRMAGTCWSRWLTGDLDLERCRSIDCGGGRVKYPRLAFSEASWAGTGGGAM